MFVSRVQDPGFYPQLEKGGGGGREERKEKGNSEKNYTWMFIVVLFTITKTPKQSDVLQ